MFIYNRDLYPSGATVFSVAKVDFWSLRFYVKSRSSGQTPAMVVQDEAVTYRY